MTFDVFLSHNSKDKPTVRRLRDLLSAREIKVWYDEDELRPGMPWQQLLEQGIELSTSIAVLIGKDGLGPWEDEEMQAVLRLAVRDRRPVIPVMLPDAPATPELPMFLGNRTWVDLRDGINGEGFERLIWGITGQKPMMDAEATQLQSRSALLHSLAAHVEEVLHRLSDPNSRQFDLHGFDDLVVMSDDVKHLCDQLSIPSMFLCESVQDRRVYGVKVYDPITYGKLKTPGNHCILFCSPRDAGERQANQLNLQTIRERLKRWLRHIKSID